MAAMLVPQGMAYAKLAGLPPVVGLYASVVPLLAYAALGSSRRLAVGPVAIVSLLTYGAIAPLAEPGSPASVALAALLMAMVGVLQALLALLRAGGLSVLLSRAVVSGFTSAAAILIAVHQLAALLGVDAPSGASVVATLASVTSGAPAAHLPTLAIGVSAVAALLIAKRFAPGLPAALLVVAVAALMTASLGVHHGGVAVVGAVPGGLPPLALPGAVAGLPSALAALAPAAVAIALLGFVESLAVARALAEKHRGKIDPNRELAGLGFANLAGSAFGGYPVAGGFSRSAVADRAGARSQATGVVAALLVLAALTFLTGTFRTLPDAALAAVVLTAVLHLVDLRTPRELWRIKRIDAVTLAVTFAATLALGVEVGLLVGVAFSLAVFVARSARPHAAELGYLSEEGAFRNVARYPNARTWPEAVVFRPDESLYFANMAYLDRRLAEAVADRPRLKHVILDLSGVADVDAVAVEALARRATTLAAQGVTLHLSGVKGPVRDVLTRAGWRLAVHDDPQAAAKNGRRAGTSPPVRDHLTLRHAALAAGLELHAGETAAVAS